MRVIITEKPAVSRALAQTISQFYPTGDIYFIEAQPFWLNNLKMPRGLALTDFPYFEHPVYKRDEPLNWGTLKRRLSQHVAGNCVPRGEISLDNAREILLSAEEVICACDWDHTGQWGFDLFIEQTLGDDRPINFPVLVLSGGMDTRSIEKAFNSMITTDHPHHNALLSAGKAKRLFEYSYAVNSLGILGNLYRKLAGTKEPVFVSKYGLQTLLWLTKNGPMATWKVQDKMSHDWTGTGKYPKGSMKHLYGMGSAASRSSIIGDLVRIGLLDETDVGMISVTALGKSYVDALHPDCRDEDLPFRIDAWMSQGIEVSEPAIKRYLSTFFGKQARHQAAITAPKG